MKILSFDIEEWFHILDNSETKGIKEWSSFESRIHKNMNLIFDILDQSNTPATFFVVGWICEKYPEIIKEISNRGFEIGSHTHLHQLVYNQNSKIFKNDVERSIKILEDCTGHKVKSFRAPGFSIKNSNKWAFETLHQLGIEFDSSIFPSIRSHGGFPSYKTALPSIIEYNGIRLKEFPINTHNILGKSLIFSGGGYFRLLPYEFIKSFTRKSDYIMSYFHPRDFDYEQPMIPGLSMTRRYKSFVGLKKCKSKLLKWIDDFDFIDMREADNMINWEKAPIVKL